jgi:hypothetical protein
MQQTGRGVLNMAVSPTRRKPWSCAASGRVGVIEYDLSSGGAWAMRREE